MWGWYLPKANMLFIPRCNEMKHTGLYRSFSRIQGLCPKPVIDIPSQSSVIAHNNIKLALGRSGKRPREAIISRCS